MRKIINWLFGVVVGASAGTALVALLSPISAAEARRRVKEGYAETMESARLAGLARRAELEAQLAEMKKARSTQ